MDESGGDQAEREAVDARIIRTRNDVLGAALRVLVEQGREALTHQHLAHVAGYSRATVYKHWPTRTALLRDAFARLDDVRHHTPTGDLRADLIEELATFRAEMAEHRLDRALAVLMEMATSAPEIAEVRDRLVADGERVVRQLLAPVPQDGERQIVPMMLCGAVLYSALMHGQLPSREAIATGVDIVLRGLDISPY